MNNNTHIIDELIKYDFEEIILLYNQLFDKNSYIICNKTNIVSVKRILKYIKTFDKNLTAIIKLEDILITDIASEVTSIKIYSNYLIKINNLSYYFDVDIRTLSYLSHINVCINTSSLTSDIDLSIFENNISITIEILHYNIMNIDCDELHIYMEHGSSPNLPKYLINCDARYLEMILKNNGIYLEFINRFQSLKSLHMTADHAIALSINLPSLQYVHVNWLFTKISSIYKNLPNLKSLIVDKSIFDSHYDDIMNLPKNIINVKCKFLNVNCDEFIHIVNTYLKQKQIIKCNIINSDKTILNDFIAEHGYDFLKKFIIKVYKIDKIATQISTNIEKYCKKLYKRCG